MTRLTYATCLLLAFALVPACGKSEGAAPSVGAEATMALSADLGPDAIVEEHDDGSISWQIAPDGQVRAAVVASASGRVTENVNGSMVYKLQSGETKTVPLVMEPKTGVLVAAGPKLDADLTEVNYTLAVSGKPWTGVMHVPAGGTAAIATTAKASVEVKLPDQPVGPHGGTIQVVGDDRLEMVGDPGGEVRVYVLDADLRPRTTLEGRTLRMGFIAAKPEVVAFTAAPTGAYFVGRVGSGVAVDPLRVTVSLGFGGVTRAAIWGYRPGVRIVAPTATVRIATAPRIRFRLTGGFDSGVDVYGRTRVRVEERDDDDDRRKGNNGRHFGQDGTFARDSGGFKSDDDRHPGGAVKVRGGADVHVSVRGGSDHGGGKPSGGGGKSSGGGDRGGGDKGGGKGGKR